MENQISIFDMEDCCDGSLALVPQEAPLESIAIPDVAPESYGVRKLPELSLVETFKGEFDVFIKGVFVGVIVRESRRDGSPPVFLAYVLDEEEDDRYLIYSHRHLPLKSIYRYRTLMEAKKAIMEEAPKFKKAKPVAFLPKDDMEFYPTPSEIAGKLFSMIDWKELRDSACSVLEPSAGRGDLVDYLRSYMGRDVCDRASIDVVELDTNLQAMLTGKGYRLVGDDFLTFNTSKAYDLICLNPPFLAGDLHLLHAIELMHKGQIVCILNAETIRNPYTNSRKALAKELKRLNADIRFVEDGMRNGPRKANVDLALIHIKVDSAMKNDWILENLRKAGKVFFEEEARESMGVTFSNPVDRLIREYTLTVDAAMEFFKTYNGLRTSFSGVNVGVCVSDASYDWRAGEVCFTTISNSFLNKFLEKTRLVFWKRLFDLPVLQDHMTSDMKNAYSEKISSMREYEFSEFNVQQVIADLKLQLNDGVVDAIYKCFDKLSNVHAYHEDLSNENIHYYNGWKTNKAHYVNMKCIIPTYGAFATKYVENKKTGRFEQKETNINPHSCFAVLDDLEKALDYLDRGETAPTSLSRVLQIAAEAGKTTVTCKYFTVTFYKKGTCHIKFHDQKIVDRLNIFVGKNRMWLPPTYGKARYEDMDSESKRVVDEFMGKEHYDKVMKNPGNFIVEASESEKLLAGESA